MWGVGGCGAVDLVDKRVNMWNQNFVQQLIPGTSM